MLSDSIREMRKRAEGDAHGGRVMSGDDMLAMAAQLAAFEVAARNLEDTVRNSRSDTSLFGTRRVYDPIRRTLVPQ